MENWRFGVVAAAALSLFFCGCAGMSVLRSGELGAYLRAHPTASVVDVPGAAPLPYVLVYKPKERPGDIETVVPPSVLAFDRSGKLLYRHDGLFRWQSGQHNDPHPPVVLDLPGRPFGFLETWWDPGKVSGCDLYLVGIRQGNAEEVKLPCIRHGSPPCEIYFRIWKEDIDGDGREEICRVGCERVGSESGYASSPLQCLRWDPERGNWLWDRELAGKWTYALRAPLTCHTRVSYDAARRTLSIDLQMENTAEQSLTIEQPTQPLISRPAEAQSRSGYHVYDQAPRDNWPSPVIVKAGGADWGPRNWPVTPVGRAGARLTIPPCGAATLKFRITVPENRTVGKGVSLLYTARVRWGNSESIFSYLDSHRAVEQKAEATAK